ncbi:hypothetical protein MLD38_013054 [Melastoma candidum]|uniref:Uncharacterized protein n=1 Tax=Melastoma candidum TaxID=119954 RepID=A0ACB9R8G0_9MYRT|nr:hypothetical protein MLD38_013054 [Melastoma candidum]
MTAMMVNVASDFDGCKRPTKELKRVHTTCPTVGATKKRRISFPSDGDGIHLTEADEDYLYFLRQRVSIDSDVCSFEDDRDDSPAVSDVDPHYKIFLENLKIDGKSYALEVELEGRTMLLKYESEGSPSIAVNPEILENGVNDSKKERARCIRSCNKTRDERDSASNTLRKNDGNKENNRRKDVTEETSHEIRKIEVNQKKVVCRRNNPEAEAKITSSRTEIYSGNEFDESVYPHNLDNSVEDEEAWDESLLAFVQCLRNDGNVLIYTHDDGSILRYAEEEEEDDGDVDSDVEILDRADFAYVGKNNPFVSARSPDVINVENKECSKVPPGSDSDFRAGLKSELEMPYDDKEYEDLMKMVNHKRCKEVDKELRGGREVSYSLKDVCKSYLEVHKDFARALKHVQGDRKRTLNLLRGFRYWLHNVPKKGSFFPWSDTECLSLLPGP